MKIGNMGKEGGRKVALGEATINHVVAKTNWPRDYILTLVSELVQLGYGKDEIYNQLMSGFGVKKSHASAHLEKDDGKMKRGPHKSNRRGHSK